MTYTGPHCYTLLLAGNEDARVIAAKLCDGIEAEYALPVTKIHTPKIYIVKEGDALVYVGYTSQSIAARFRQGIKASGVKGKYGYQWIVASELQLLVFVFDQKLNGNSHADDKTHIALAEAVEAELVYTVRNKTGKWPAYQNEIHFNNSQSDLARTIASEIYQKIAAT